MTDRRQSILALTTLSVLLLGSAPAWANQHEEGTQDEESAQARQPEETFTHPTSLPPNGFYADDLINAEVRTRGEDENVGLVDSLIIDQDSGEVIAVVVSYGGLLGLGERDAALPWDLVEQRMENDQVKLLIDMTRDELENVPEFTGE